VAGFGPRSAGFRRDGLGGWPGWQPGGLGGRQRERGGAAQRHLRPNPIGFPERLGNSDLRSSRGEISILRGGPPPDGFLSCREAADCKRWLQSTCGCEIAVGWQCCPAMPMSREAGTEWKGSGHAIDDKSPARFEAGVILHVAISCWSGSGLGRLFASAPARPARHAHIRAKLTPMCHPRLSTRGHATYYPPRANTGPVTRQTPDVTRAAI
jgi:hypothetical protein